MHQGHAICRIAGIYPTVLKVILECVQNSIDSNAKNVWISINNKANAISIRDDGRGVSDTMFDEALKSVCESKKTRGDLGRFGIGLISPLGKCLRFTFTSSPIGADSYKEWLFVSKDVESSREIPRIPMESRGDISRNGRQPGKSPVKWSTEVSLQGVTRDPQISKVSMTDLVESILDKFGKTMLRKGTIVHIRLVDDQGKEAEQVVCSTTSTGTPLEEFSTGKPGSVTRFKLFIARRIDASRKGKVLVGEHDDEYRFTFAELIRSTDLVSKEAAEALSSGLFEGEITSESAKLHHNRIQFQEGESLLGFCLAVNKWFKEVGSKHLEQARSDKRDSRRQELGEASMKHIEDLIMNNDEFKHLRNVIESFRIGSVGSGHVRVPKKKIVGPDVGPSISVTGDTGGNGDGGGSSGGSPKTEHTGHVPFLVGGPLGQVRTLVKGSSIGLKFNYTELLQVIWYLDTKTGVLHFNTRHPVWQTCEEAGDKHIRQYQEFIAITALSLETVSDDSREHARAFAEGQASVFAVILTSSDAFKARMTQM